MNDNKQNVGYYDIVKLCKGGLALRLPTFDSSAIDRRIDFQYNTQKIRVPRAYALGVFVDSTLERMYKEGYFRVEPAEQFEKEVAEIFYPVENKQKVYINSDLLGLLKSGNRVKIKELIEQNSVNKDNIIITAREHIGDLSNSMIKDLERILGVELEVENE